MRGRCSWVVMWIVATILCSTAGAAPHARPAWSIAFTVAPPSIGDVVGIDVRSAGSAARRLVRRPRGSTAWHDTPLWSPDGRHVAFVRFDPQLSVLVATTADRRVRRIREHDRASSPPPGIGRYVNAWSRDSRRLGMAVNRELFVANRDGTRLRLVTRISATRDSSARIASIDWSPNGRQILVLATRTPREEAGQDAIYVVDVATGAQRLLVDGRSEGLLGPASWSPDGSRIAYGKSCRFVFRGDVYCSIAVLDLDGGDRRTLVARDAYAVPPVWRPRTDELVVPTFGAHTVVVDAGTGRRRLLRSPFVMKATVSADGRRFGYITLSSSNRGAIVLVDLRTGRTIRRWSIAEDPVATAIDLFVP